MESIQGVDISWMTSHSSSKDHNPKPPTPPVTTIVEKEPPKSVQNGNVAPAENHTAPDPIPAHRPSFSRSASSDRTATLNGSAPKSSSPTPSTSRRNSWLSSISSKFSSSQAIHHAQNAPPSPLVLAISATQTSSEEITVPAGPYSPKNAVLPHAVRSPGDVPYTPAPPKSTQPSFLQSALRRLSSSGGQLSHQPRGPQHGLCERRVLNVDRSRERCAIADLEQSKLRRVAFCVDVEIASSPRYVDEVVDEKPRVKKKRKSLAEKGEAEVLKHPEADIDQKENGEVIKATREKFDNGPEKGALEIANEVKADSNLDKDNKKKEKKKRSEEERKARKEKKRKLAEANGTIPVELVRNGSDSSNASSGGNATPTTQVSPTTDPVRIYRRCCQLRETPILKKITEQLMTPASNMATPGIVNSLDLTGYWLQLPDLVTLGDYLAVVPVKEIIMENCGLTDEGVRVILAGLLAAKFPDGGKKKPKIWKDGNVVQGGVVERVVFKNNNKIGKEGWRHISLFINMCRSLKSMDLSKVPFPQPPPLSTSPVANSHHLHRTLSTTSAPELSCLLSKALGERLAGKEFELLNVAECGLTTDQLGGLIDGAIKSGLRRLGIAESNITPEGMQHVARFLRDGKCEGLDLGGNDLRDHLGTIASALDTENDLYALSLADCNLTPDSLWTLFPALSKLSNFRFIDLSQNHALFKAQPSALSLLRRYIPKMPILRRIHLTDVSMTPDQAIALAEILPESQSLAHLNIMENPQIAALANAKDEASQEEACALYASLMAAVRVSKTIMCIDIEVPANDSSEVVKALAKQVVAYCLRNMERGPVAEISQVTATSSDIIGGEKEVVVPDVLLHLVGHEEGASLKHDDDDPAPDDDYVIGGSGVVKALGICLKNRGNDSRRPTTERSSEYNSGAATPTRPPVNGGKAKDMSKNLLGSARKIRARLQPALVKESRANDSANYQRLQFLDRTLEGMINRFEDEFPETRVDMTTPTPPVAEPTEVSPSASLEGSVEFMPSNDGQGSDGVPSHLEVPVSDDEGENGLRPVLSRHNSDVSLASRALNEEEGRMHRFGQQFRRDILKPESEDHRHGTIGTENEPKHLQVLRAMVEGLGGEEIRQKVETHGHQALLNDFGTEASELKQQLKDQDLEGWEKFVESQKAAQRNASLDVRPTNESSPGHGSPLNGSAIAD
ncbi:hypothetical protein BJ875DRAFT_442789 [Amylocarpus encephaloides]|uniref:Cell wall biogenesis protein Mhp1 n=1 Tax=Amylocarpus encephaloides TaxID=45428 RepID=A0A9P8C3Q6_9HELO|nr:hypothetical protein BJ875DRAFT_442789 [Amylocarpus encephaloides]